MMFMASSWDSLQDSFKAGTNLGQVRRFYGATNQIATFLIWSTHVPIPKVWLAD